MQYSSSRTVDSVYEYTRPDDKSLIAFLVWGGYSPFLYEGSAGKLTYVWIRMPYKRTFVGVQEALGPGVHYERDPLTGKSTRRYISLSEALLTEPEFVLEIDPGEAERLIRKSEGEGTVRAVSVKEAYANGLQGAVLLLEMERVLLGQKTHEVVRRVLE